MPRLNMWRNPKNYDKWQKHNKTNLQKWIDTCPGTQGWAPRALSSCASTRAVSYCQEERAIWACFISRTCCRSLSRKRGLRLEYLSLLDQGAAPAAADCAAVNAWLFRQPVALPAVRRRLVASDTRQKTWTSEGRAGQPSLSDHATSAGVSTTVYRFLNWVPINNTLSLTRTQILPTIRSRREHADCQPDGSTNWNVQATA